MRQFLIRGVTDSSLTIVAQMVPSKSHHQLELGTYKQKTNEQYCMSMLCKGSGNVKLSKPKQNARIKDWKKTFHWSVISACHECINVHVPLKQQNTSSQRKGNNKKKNMNLFLFFSAYAYINLLEEMTEAIWQTHFHCNPRQMFCRYLKCKNIITKLEGIS